MYKVMIVDDEPWTIIDIEQTFKLDEMGFEIAGSYRTPLKALPAIVKTRPDLIITDIRMPGMDGIELMKQVRSQQINCEFIIVSGYSEFTYAREALTCGAKGYCLKPLNPAETLDCLVRVKEALDRRKPLVSEVQAENLSDSPFDQMINYLSVHFSEKITLKHLAACFHMNPNYCCSLFNKHLGKTFSQYLTEIRLKEAANLLCATDYPLDKIAAMVGFSDYFYFSKVFKKNLGCSPKEYRKLHN